MRKEEGKKQLSISWCSKCVPTTEHLLVKVHASYSTLLLHLKIVGFGEIFGRGSQSLWVLKSTSGSSGLSQDLRKLEAARQYKLRMKFGTSLEVILQSV